MYGRIHNIGFIFNARLEIYVRGKSFGNTKSLISTHSATETPVDVITAHAQSTRTKDSVTVESQAPK